MARSNRTQPVKLNADCQWLILKECDLASLISLSQTNMQFSFMVKDILRQKFAKKLIIFSVPQFNGKIELHIHEDSDYIKVQHLHTILKILKHFGHLIRNLKIQHSTLPNKKISSVYKFVNLYCSDTLRQLHMTNSLGKFFDQFSKPFRSVENLTLHGIFDKLSSSQLTFVEVFPAISLLSLDMIQVKDMSWIDCTFSHLEHLDVFIWGNTGTLEGFPESATERLIRSNPQIRSLMLRNATPKLLKLVAIELHELESLELRSYNGSNFENHELIFNTVKVFKTQHGLESVPKNITFNKLEEFQTDGFPKRCSKWIELVEKNKSLKKLRVIQRYLDNEDVFKLAMANLNLTEISAAFDQEVIDESIIKLVENSKNLRKIKLISFGAELNKSNEISLEEVLQKSFGSEWHINEKTNDIVFERSN